MEKLNGIDAVVEALRNYQIIKIENPTRTYFFIKNDQVQVLSDHAQFILTIEAFKELYTHSQFYLHEPIKQNDIEPTKDDEYYAWKHK